MTDMNGLLRECLGPDVIMSTDSLKKLSRAGWRKQNAHTRLRAFFLTANEGCPHA
jgi:hypothetical protein